MVHRNTNSAVAVDSATATKQNLSLQLPSQMEVLLWWCFNKIKHHHCNTEERGNAVSLLAVAPCANKAGVCARAQKKSSDAATVVDSTTVAAPEEG